MNRVLPHIAQLHGYVPGEQPQVPGLIKLNTNENPYGPPPRALAALRDALDDRLRLYPDPTATELRKALAARYDFPPDQIIVGNGCDDILNLCVRAFCGPGDRLAYLWPSYSLYPVLAAIQNAQPVELPLDDQFQIPAHPAWLRQLDRVRLLFITQPNAPSGVWLPRVALQRVIEETPGVVVIDEAYVDFAADNCLDFARDYPNVIVARSFSKSYALAGLRIGWAVGPAELIRALQKVKDSYNVNRLSQLAARAALEDDVWLVDSLRRIRITRECIHDALLAKGFFVFPSQTNFLFARPPAPLTARRWFEALRADYRILTRWWDADRIRDFVRISIGTDDEMNKFLEATGAILEKA
ncbi:MAG: histidinol-phosphate transaminase [Verrucomicrobiae bacterium]|nr:histidinol-phosphate transaminase [Verrucomicrobiae bacterium]